MDVLLVCKDAVVRGTVRHQLPVPVRVSDVLNSNLTEIDLFDAEVLTATPAARALIELGREARLDANITAIRRSSIIVAVPGAEPQVPHTWDTFIQKSPSSVAMMVGEDLRVRGNVWRLPGADLAMAMRLQTSDFLPVTDADIDRVVAGRQAKGWEQVARRWEAVLVNRAAVTMWTAVAPVEVAAQNHIAPDPLPVAAVLGGLVGRRALDLART